VLGTTRRLVIPVAALLWGLQFALLNPALAALLVGVFDATPGQVGWTLSIYNASGFVAALLIPVRADRRGDYVRPMLWCAVLTLALAGVLSATTSLPAAVCALAALGGPAGVGNSLLFAHLKHAGASTDVVVRTRAVVSFAWVAGPPLATLVISGFGVRAVLVLLAAVSVLTIAVTAVMARHCRTTTVAAETTDAGGGDRPRRSVGRIAVVVGVFVALQATNAATVAVMTLFVTDRMRLPVAWAGVALGVAAALEIPALLAIGRLSRRFAASWLIASGCVAGLVFYTAMAYARGPAMLLGLQVLNAWFFAAVAGVGLTLFQDLIPRPGLASGVYVNTRRVGAILSGPIIGLGATSALGYGGVFLICAAVTAAALILLGSAAR
jgi:SET family sugar efflux transporter-like MFS transporter